MKVIQNVEVYRSRVQYYQWKSETHKMKIDDMKIFIRTIEKCIVSRNSHMLKVTVNSVIDFLIRSRKKYKGGSA